MQVAFLIGDFPIPHEVAVHKPPQAHGASVVVRYFVAQQVAGLHAPDRALNHAYVVLADTAGVRDGGDQVEPVIFITQSFYRFRIGKSRDDIFGYQPKAAIRGGEGAVNLPEPCFYSDGAQLLPAIIQQERLRSVFQVRQAVLGEGNNLAKRGFLLLFVPHGTSALPGSKEPRERHKFGG